MNACEIYFIGYVFAKLCCVVADRFFISLCILNLISRNNKHIWKLPQIVFLWRQEINLAMEKVITSSRVLTILLLLRFCHFHFYFSEH